MSRKKVQECLCNNNSVSFSSYEKIEHENCCKKQTNCLDFFSLEIIVCEKRKKMIPRDAFESILL